MSVMEADEQDRGTVLHYAPRHLRAPEERSIRPILERLSRGEGGAPAETKTETNVHVPMEFDPPRKAIGWPLFATCALSAGLSAGLAVFAIGWLAQNKAELTRIDAIQLDPKFVHTVSFKPDAPAAKHDAPTAAPSETDLQKQAPESAPPIQPKEAPPPSKAEAHKDQIAPKELLALWSGIPADVPAAAAAEESASAAATPDEPAPAESETPPVRETPHRAAPENRRHAHLRHRTNVLRVHATRKQQPAQSTAAAQNGNVTPLGSALQSLLQRSASPPAAASNY
jgi:hypothetical protein